VNQGPFEYRDRSKTEETGVHTEGSGSGVVAWCRCIKDSSVNDMVRRPMTRERLPDVGIPGSFISCNLRTTRTVHDLLASRSYDWLESRG
jgi:hypothetical protein